MEVIFVYYNRETDNFYFMVCRNNCLYFNFVFEKTRFNSILVQKIVFDGRHLLDEDVYIKERDNEKNKLEQKIIKKRMSKIRRRDFVKRLINHLIDLLYKIKSRF